jgi:hypothetical protein
MLQIQTFTWVLQLSDLVQLVLHSMAFDLAGFGHNSVLFADWRCLLTLILRSDYNDCVL